MFGSMPTGGPSLVGASPGAYDPRYGGIPQVPNPAATSASAIAANMGNLSQLDQLFGGLNTFNAGQAANQLKTNLPGYEGLIGQRSGVIGQELKGQLPQDVLDQIIQRSAERGIATGSPISPNNNAAYLKALGLTSLGQISKGMTDLSGAIHDTPTAPLANPASMFITPDAIQQAQMGANIYASAPQPAAAARAAQSAGSIRVPSGGGWSSGVRTPTFSMGGAGGIYKNPEPQYGTYGGGALGPFYEGDPYQNWNDWYKSLNTGGLVQGGVDDGIDWEWFNDASNFEDSGRYDPILDVSINPASLSGGGDWYDFSGFDPGF